MDEKSNLNSSPLVQVLLSVLNRKEKLQLIAVFVLTLIGVVVETLSIGLVLPFVAALTGDFSSEARPWIPAFLGDLDQVQLVRLSMFAIVVLYVLKNLFVIWSQWIQSGIKLQISARLSQDLFASYLRKDFEFHMKTNSSIILRNCQNAAVVLAGVIEPVLTIVSDVLVTAALVTLLVYVEPVGTLVTVSMFVFYAVSFDRFSRQRLRLWGTIRQKHSGLLIKHQQQGLGAIKEIKIMRIEDAFLRQHQESLLTHARVTRRFVLLNVVPRVSLEVVTIIGIAVLVFLFSAKDDGFTDVLPILGLFAVSALRIQPAVTRVVANRNAITYNRPIVDELYGDFDVPGKTTTAISSTVRFSNEIELDRVTFNYETSTIPVLKDFSLKIRHGEIIGISGSSGSGKTTLMDLLLGLIKPSSGSIRVDGVDIFSDLGGWQEQVGFVSQSVYLLDDSIDANIALGVPRSEIDQQRITDVLKEVDLWEFVERLPNGVNTNVGERGTRLSGGQLQRIGIARALYRKPSILFLDESTSALDSVTEESVMVSILRLARTMTIVIVAHRESTLQHCSRRLVVEGGLLIADSSVLGEDSVV
jgi:ABC-type multidrug transport system fused ATPase/permease subunit